MKPLILKLYWAVTRAYLRFRGAEVGKNVKCNGFPHVKIRKGGRLIIGDGVQINAAPWANAHVVKGSTNLFVAAGATLRIGNQVGISGSRIVAMREIEIEEGTLVGAGCLICDSDMHEIPLGSDNPTRSAPVRIGKGVFVAANSMILKGVVIGDGAVVGACSVVVKPIPIHCMVAGNPAKTIKTYAASPNPSE